MICLLKRTTLLYLFTTCFKLLYSQDLANKEFARSVQDADKVYLFDKDYEKAAGLYESLLKTNPDNANLAAKLGICYLNIEGTEQDALKLLKQASANVATEQEYVYHGVKAQQDTYLYLAEAYHMNDSLEKALTIYYDARKKLGKFDALVEEYIDKQIGSCRYAIEQKKKPLTILSDFFAPWLKDYPGATNPVLARNDSVFVFTQKTDGKTRILCSYKTKGQWGKPSDITEQLGGMDRFYSNSITGDGKTLVIFLDDGGDGNLYFCNRSDTTWTKIKSPGKPINTIFWESYGFITPDGNTIYIASNRPGGSGDLDIWVSDKMQDGNWGVPVNCGEIINTPYDEDAPFYDPANKALIYSSSGHVGMGGYDVFRSTKRYDSWTNPVSLPYAFNTTTDNKLFILNNNAPGFVASRFDDKTRTRNIYAIVAIDPADEITTAEGALTLKDGMAIDARNAILKLTDIKNKTAIVTIPVKEDGTFKFDIKPGDYELTASHQGYRTETINLNLPLYNLSHYMVVNAILEPDKVADGSFLSIKNILFEFDSYAIDEQAKSGLEMLRAILTEYPDLKIEVAGYTDAKGPSAYNMKLADKRAQAAIDYLVSASVPEARFVKKAFGESNFAAINTNRDGSDNPEGRKYNRRVAFGIIDPHTGVVIRQEPFTPENLKPVTSMKYSIILKKSAEKLPQSFFDDIKLNGMLYVRTIQTDSIAVYSLGIFYSRADALKFLDYVRQKGFNEAYIINYYDLNNLSASTGLIPVVSQVTGKKIYTIQLKATQSPADMAIFKDFKGVKEIHGDDGFYRYVFGEYPQFSKAKEAIYPFLKAGFDDAFIRELDLLMEK